MGATVSALTAQNAGAGKGDRARQVLKDAMTISVVYGCLITVLMWLVAPAFIGFFFAKDAAVVAAGTGYMRSYIFRRDFLPASTFAFSGFFAAYGKSYIGFAHNVLAVVLIRVPGAWLLSNAYSDTLFPMGIASPCGSILSAVICVVCVYRYSTGAGLLTSWWRSGTPSKLCPDPFAERSGPVTDMPK